MADTKFTKGEWRISGDETYNNVRNIYAYKNGSSFGVGVAEISGFDFDANAHLIAAAPDLYAVLDEINTWCGTDEGAHYLPFEPPWYTNLRAALAKARGEQ